MTANNHDALLNRYSRHGDEEAFRELVHRHAGLVYAAVQRRLGNRSDQAADVAQAVFVKLAQRARARALPVDVVLPVWLHSTAVRLASNHLRSESRRALREQTSLAMIKPVNTPPVWQSLAPELDEALLSLKGKDRQALLLRYFEGKDVAATGHALGISPDAAQKRIARALDRLRSLLARRGVTVSAVALALCLGTPAARAAPAGFAGRAAAAGLAAKPLPWLAGLFRAAPWSGAAGAAAALAVFVFIPAPPDKGMPAAVMPPSSAAAVPPAEQPTAPSAAFAGVRALMDESLTPQQIVAELDRLSRMPRTTTNRLHLAAVLEKITAANAAHVAELCDETLTFSGENFAILPVLLQWRCFDPAAMLEFAIESRVDQRFNGSGMGIVFYLTREWAGQDLERASAWVVKNLNNRPHGWKGLTVAADVLDKLCAKSPEQGADFVIRLPEGEMKQRLVAALAGEQVSEPIYRMHWQSAEWAALAGAVAGRGESLPPDCLPALIGHWAESDAAAARAWVESLPESPQKLRAATGYAGAESVVVVAPVEAGGFSMRHDAVRDKPERAAWILSLTNDETRGPALRHIAQGWHNDKAREWIVANSTGAERDQALRIMAGKELEHKEVAFKHAAAIADESLKRDVIAGLYLNWHQNYAKGAEEWLAAANLPEAVKSKLEALTP